MIEAFKFGSITVNGKEFKNDVIISKQGVEERKASEHHFVEGNEVQEILKKFDPLILVIGTGAYGVVQVLEGAELECKKNQTQLIKARTNEAKNIYNDLESKGKKVIAIMHLTC